MKTKFLKTLGLAVAPVAVIAPLAATISCGPNSGNNGSSTETKEYKLLPTYTGQADQLIALGIKSDYYPLQLDQKVPFSYLTNPAQFMKGQSEEFKAAFSKKIKELMPDVQGTSWWNQQALEDGEKGSDPEYWQHIKGTLTLYEHYLLDDGAKAIDKSTAPQHTDTPQTFIETNFRESRDPYTRLPKIIIEALLDKDKYDSTVALGANEPDAKIAVNVVNKMLEVARKIEGEDSSKISVDGKNAPSGKAQREASDEESWIYNDFVFARAWHTQFLDNDQFKKTSFAEWVLSQRTSTDHADNWAFDSNSSKDEELSNLFFASTYTPEEKALDLDKFSAKSYDGLLAWAKHHPIYEQQEDLGGAPMFEGAMRDNSLYLYDLASEVQNAFTQDTNAEGTKYLLKQFADDNRLDKLEHTLDNADQINKELRARMAKVKVLVDKLPADKKTFGVLTIAPGGGVSTIQSSSKYSFLYKELGFNQPLPKAFPAVDQIAPNDGSFKKDAFFNMDDNGWWWNISTPGQENGISDDRVSNFDRFNYGVLTANDKQYNGVLKDSDKDTLAKIMPTAQIGDWKRDYNLWNEGLKTPFVMHMILDEVVDQIKVDAHATSTELSEAQDWGNYFTKTFIS